MHVGIHASGKPCKGQTTQNINITNYQSSPEKPCKCQSCKFSIMHVANNAHAIHASGKPCRWQTMKMANCASAKPYTWPKNASAKLCYLWCMQVANHTHASDKPCMHTMHVANHASGKHTSGKQGKC
jgi:hypothetical protein